MSTPTSKPASTIRASAKKLGLQASSVRWMLATPLLAVLALAALLGSSFWYLTESESEQRLQALSLDVDGAQRAIRERLIAQEITLSSAASKLNGEPRARDLKQLASSTFASSPEIIFMAWVDRSGTVRAIETAQTIPTQSFGRLNAKLERGPSKEAFDYALSSRRTNYSAPITARDNDRLVDAHVPLLREGAPTGTLVISYSLPALLLNAIPKEIGSRVAFTLTDADDQMLAQTKSPALFEGAPFLSVSLEPVGRGVALRGYSLQSKGSLYNNLISALIAGLVILAVVSQVFIWRNTRRRLGAESELAEETTFRRAMENSMSTGMRVINLNGEISYVNPAFCRMVGFSYDELVGHGPPFPYWPKESIEQHERNLQQMLRGESPPSSLPIHIMRKDGTRLVVRMYTSPLIDQNGKQSGWMTSVTDITEQTRIRQELAQAQERFITVLQSLDAAVSVASPPPMGELLFANQAYKKWFGNSLDQGHRFFANLGAGPWADVRDVFNPNVERWFEVRVRSIQWVDGRIVDLVVATDITQERAAEQAQREQHERLQQTSRLITMGEMASSLAHELNQPLTAIANYTSGAAARLKLSSARHEPPPIGDLIELMEKTSRQAERAGQVIRRIRGFVKRSDPIRKPIDAATIISETIGLAEIDARERGQSIRVEIAPDLPVLNVDPILIEQVLLNLIKNGLEAMRDSAEKTLVVTVKMSDSQQITFGVTDRGPGVPAAIRDRLFDSFYTTKTDGMGMGLNICRSIIESHQGRLWFEDNPTGGCTFRFTLPVLAPPQAPHETPSAEKSLT